MITEIINNLYIGTIWDAIHSKENFKLIICVAEQGNFSPQEWDDLTCQNRMFLHAPFLVYPSNYDPDGNCNEYANLNKIDFICDIIYRIIKTDKVLIHCAAGIERSPLVVVYYIAIQKMKCNDNFFKHWTWESAIDYAYQYVISKRPIVQDRRTWLVQPTQPEEKVNV